MRHFLLIALAALLCVPTLAAVPFDPFEVAGIDRRPNARIPLDLTFTDAGGTMTTLGELSGGKPVVLAPVLHDCPNICGVTLAGLGQAVRAQPFAPGRDFTLVAFGIDPEETTAQAATSLAALRKAVPDLGEAGVHALTGTSANVSALAEALGYRYGWDERIGQYAHVAATAVLTPDGKVARWLYGLTPAPQDLRLALTEAGQGQVGDWSDQLLLLCYHYDPETGRYGSLVWAALRIGGGLTVAGGLVFILAMLRREHRNSRWGPP